MKIEMRRLEDIRPYSNNARRIPSRAIDKVANSIAEFGFRQPIVVDEKGVIIVGHVRQLAAKKLGLPDVPVHVAAGLSAAQVRAYRLMDNRSHQETDWNPELLAAELLELQQCEYDLHLTGFEGFEIERLLFGDEVEAAAPPLLPEYPVTLAGDLWRCGSHRILCGDATSTADVARLLDSQAPSLMVTDPPYGVEYDPEWRERAGLGRQRQTGKVANDDRADWSPAYRLFPGDVAYVWHAGLYAAEVAAGLEEAGFGLRAQIIWSKQHFALGRGHYHWQHEPAWYAVRKGRSAHWRGDRTQSTVWQAANLNPFGGNAEEATGHGTQKPVEIMRKPLLNHLETGEVVYDPFLGSGTTLLAADGADRTCFGVEIDPRYVDVTVLRWQRASGKQAILSGSESSFETVGQQRELRVAA